MPKIPEEEVWLGKQKSARTRREYKQDVAHFMRTLNIRSYEELRQWIIAQYCVGTHHARRREKPRTPPSGEG